MATELPDKWVRVGRGESYQYLGDFFPSEAAVRGLTNNLPVRNELALARVLVKIRNEWMVNPKKFFDYYQEKTLREIEGKTQQEVA